MSAGEIVITKSIEKRSDASARPQLRQTWKTEKGFLMMVMELGTIREGTSDEDLMLEARRRLRLLGHIPSDDKAALEEALAALNNAETTS